jgi:phospholipid-binding lipoprotein MlaA
MLVSAGCATVPTDPDDLAEYKRSNDPIEPANRDIYDANQFIDRNALKPVAQAYKNYLPDPVRNGVHNILTNLGEPVVGVNDALQGNVGRAWNTVERFAVNSTIGVVGIFDVAGDWNLPHHYSDFGQTFGVWGVEEGPFLELPLLGPSNTRDAVGRVVGFAADPFSYLGGSIGTGLGYGRIAVGATDIRAGYLDSVDKITETSLDPYAAVRSLYHQNRDNLVQQGKDPAGPQGHVDVDVKSGAEPGAR